MDHSAKNFKTLVKIFYLVTFVFVALFGFSYYQIFKLNQNLTELTSNFASTTSSLYNRADLLGSNIVLLDEKLADVSNTLTVTRADLVNTTQNVVAVQSKVGGVEQTVGQISGTVNVLEKLSKTDPELLQKYSKVYFLNEHYVPERLNQIPNNYLYSESNPEFIHALVLPHLKNLIDAANRDGVTIYVKSAYRSFDEQGLLKSNYTVVYGAGTANQFSADQGYSEHQLGTTVDLITTGLGGKLEGFDSTSAYSWLLNNAYKYGFALSYPPGNNYYVFEPWHWRYVGLELATFLHNENKNFYDLDQRVIDEYLVNLFE